jgi:hypothetical protein
LPEDRPVRIDLSVPEAESLHAALEDILEGTPSDPNLDRPHRLLAWRTLAAKTGTGLTARLADLARKADTLEQYEAARDEELGPILDGLESAENRDP